MNTNLSFPYLGVPVTSQKIIPGNTAQRIGLNVITNNQFTCAYTSGGTAEIVAGDTVVGATSGVAADVVSITLTGGTWAGGDAAGVITLRNVHHPVTYAATWTTGENIKVKGGSNDATLTTLPVADTSDYEYKGASAKAALVTVMAQSALISIDGTTPDQTFKKGITVVAGGSLTLVGPEAIRNFRVLDAVASSVSNVLVTLFFHGEWGAKG